MDILRIPVRNFGGSILIGLIVAALVFAAVSTTNTFLSVCSHSIVSDFILGILTKKEISDVRVQQSEPYVALAKLLTVALVAVLIVVYSMLLWSNLLKDPLSFFYIAYSVQFALLAPMIMSVWRRWRPRAAAALLSVWIGFIVAGGLGMSSWSWLQTGEQTVGPLTPGEWLTLTPVITFLVGMIPLILGIKRNG